MLTDTSSLQSRLDAARRREREARAEAARLKRDLAHAERRRETQRLCVLGRAWEALADRHPGFGSQAERFLNGYITRDTDRTALDGTRWQQPEPSEHAATVGGEAEHEHD